MPRIAVNGTELHVEDSGGDGAPILFLHGLLMSTRMWRAQIARLRTRYRCIAFDHRNQGQSAKDPARAVTIEACYEDALALMDHLGLERCHLVGLSMGGFVALRLAARHPGRVDKLVLLDTSADPEAPENLLKYRLLVAIARVFGLRPLVGTTMKILFGQTFMRDPARAADRAHWRDELTRNDRAIVRSVLGVLEREGIARELANIRAPTLILVGEEDRATTPAKAERLRAGIAGAELVLLPRAGHMSTIEAPEAVTAAIERFLGSGGVVSRT